MNFSREEKDIDYDAPFVQFSEPLICAPTSCSSLDELATVAEFESAPIEIERRSDSKVVRYSECTADGDKAEMLCKELFAKKGFSIIPTSSFDDASRRIDVAARSTNGNFILVDVKAAKGISRSSAAQFRYHWVEIHEHGSLFSGESTALALQITEKSFLLVRKADLQRFVREKLNGKRRVLQSGQALYRPYSRPLKVREWITLVDVQDLFSFAVLLE